MNEKITYESWKEILADFEVNDPSKGAKAVLEWAYQTYSSDEIIYASSFGAEAVVLIDLIQEVKPDAHIVFLDTDLHFPETYQVIEQIEKKFPDLQIEKKKPALTLEEQASAHGTALWKRDPGLCCQKRKVEPLKEALTPRKAWISGLRREQSPTRANTNFLNRDDKFKNLKICPLIHWTWEDVWNHIRVKGLPYNELHDQGYPSIGCFPCTQAVGTPGDSRAGRWAGSGKTECGLHTN
ncbi:phosphoadenylyl-sulfate reductase [Sutcliffiella horikoshii]|uniref:phosphoadenylyl-sulfate reductase n=1 Tax=Sutcliffiella horikoshii TaxID=79883 RepID=UPI001EEF64D8|nr:phosphoadenylyl-sulfate reductase [Sutcliffiella horikoshii]MCG1023642.1 phosphoadenylyl-sulfate reductase [Sutcliffiella horikoshii]